MVLTNDDLPGIQDKLTLDDVVILQKQDKLTLARWWTVLNRHEWPTCPLEYEPPYRDFPSRRSAIMGWIMTKIGMKECLREWNRERMDRETFEAWWDSTQVLHQ